MGVVHSLICRMSIAARKECMLISIVLAIEFPTQPWRTKGGWLPLPHNSLTTHSLGNTELPMHAAASHASQSCGEPNSGVCGDMKNVTQEKSSSSTVVQLSSPVVHYSSSLVHCMFTHSCLYHLYNCVAVLKSTSWVQQN